MARKFFAKKNKLVAYVLGTAAALLGFSMNPTLEAGVISSEATLSVTVRVDTIESSETSLTPGSTQSVAVSQLWTVKGVLARSASSVGSATFNNPASGTASFLGTFQKLPTDSSGGFAATSGKLIYRFELDQAGTLFLETANSAFLQNDGFLGTNARSWFLDGTRYQSSGLNTTDDWSIAVGAGIHVLELSGAAQGAAWGERAVASGELSTVFNWGIDSLPGTLANPILPTELNPGDFGFDIVTSIDTRFYDPVVATGYDYFTSGTPFASVLVPDVLPNGDSDFQLIVGTQTFDLSAGQQFDFTSILSGGVSEFKIRGIDTSELLDPDDPTAFITGLSFTQGGEASNFRMTAFTTNSDSNVVPEPTSAMAWALLTGFAALRRRNRQST